MGKQFEIEQSLGWLHRGVHRLTSSSHLIQQHSRQNRLAVAYFHVHMPVCTMWVFTLVRSVLTLQALREVLKSDSATAASCPRTSALLLEA